MNLKNFEYLNKDIPFLKKELLFRSIFAVMFFAVFLIQFISMIKLLISQTLNIGMAISTTVVLLTCALFCLISIVYMLKTLNIIKTINNQGRCVSSVDILLNTKKDSFIKLYSIVCDILALVASIVLVCSFTYAILQASYYATTSYYLPLLVTISLSAFYSVFHIKNEIKTVQTVNQYNSIY